MDAACLDVGRNPAMLRRSVGVAVAMLGRDDPHNALLSGSPEEIAEILRAFAREGISEVQIELLPRTLAGIAAFAPVLESLKGQLRDWVIRRRIVRTGLGVGRCHGPCSRIDTPAVAWVTALSDRGD